jgi:hypothetical protein
MPESPVIAAEYLRDPIYGLVPLSAGEVALLSLPLVGRLKGIRQMGFAYSVFPGANHTRFEHSVGVLHAAGLLAQGIPGLSPKDLLRVRLGGLFHDVGHPPFSHTLELAARLYGRELSSPELLAQVSHEEVTRQRVSGDPELREVLSSRPEFRGLTAREVADLAVGLGKDPTLNALVHGEIDADRIDYIVRDNHHCGFPSGVDVHLLPSLFWRDAKGGLVLNRDRAYFAEQLLLARHHLQVRIHDEPRNRVADLLLARALRAYFLHAGPEARDRFAATVREGGDGELLALLRERVPQEIRDLDHHLQGSPPWLPLAELPFERLSPAARYALSLLLTPEHRDLLVPLTGALTRALGQEVLVDLWGAVPPGSDLRVGLPGAREPPEPLNGLPLVRGTVQATHRAMGVRLRVARGAPKPRLTLAALHARYVRWVDPFFTLDRAERTFHRLPEGEREPFLLALAVESALLSTVGRVMDRRVFRPSALLVALSALFEAFASPPLSEPRVFLEEEGFPGLVRTAGLSEAWPRVFQEPFPYRVPPAEEPPTSDPVLDSDRERLEAFGLLLHLSRVERRGGRFLPRSRHALSGWGRGWVRHGLLKDPRLARAHGTALDRLRAHVAQQEEVYRAYFALAGRPGGRLREERARLRGALPLLVSI